MSFGGVKRGGKNGWGATGGVGGKSAASGAPTATIITTGNNSWVVGVGNDFDNAVARTVGSGQTLVHQDLAPSGDTYWVQRQINPIANSGTSVTINDTAPTKDRFNLSIAEILAASGGTTSTPPTVSMTSPAGGALLSGLATVSAAASGQVAVAGVPVLLDGASLGAELYSSPYSLSWVTH